MISKALVIVATTGEYEDRKDVPVSVSLSQDKIDEQLTRLLNWSRVHGVNKSEQNFLSAAYARDLEIQFLKIFGTPLCIDYTGVDFHIVEVPLV